MYCRKSLLVKTVFLVGAFALSGCGSADLAEVKEFSRLAKVAKERSEVVGKDFYPSCMRSSQYVPVIPLPSSNIGQNSPAVRSFLEQLPTEAREELERARDVLSGALESTTANINNERSGGREQLPASNLAEISSSSDPLVVRNELRSVCDRHLQAIGSDFASVNGVVILYVTKLGAIADRDLTNLDTEFSAIQTSAQNLTNSAQTLFSVGQPIGTPVIPPEQLQSKVDAAVGIFQFIAEALLEGKQREVLASAIVERNDDFQAVLEALKTVVRDYYIAIELRNEEAALDTFYTAYIDALEQSPTFQSGDSVISITQFLLELEASWNQEKEVIQARREFAQAYIGVLNALSAGHDRLFAIFAGGKTPSQEQARHILDRNTAALKTFIEKSDALRMKETQK